ncbi:ammonium transporter [Deinococcus cellulosilyticus]|uniref:Ammonium transporter n=1 Tax=Deinococcus cellulosilyticus (strain DSM 18568 / NBRC 106333 / KACC 11606 / 5516J-15) TaxID=1223518 RepID=A0A511N1S9_DEIC1|nr:ammonium transporter [Deinococcus cellulosilyticus]GEM46789.1 ammonium transporter [Deinococcus cellulosilyticus NBRC 106333 = KACC 11606]
MKRNFRPHLLLLLFLIASAHAQQTVPLTLDRGDTAWMLMSSALVLLMTPGLAFFYGGLTRTKSVLNTIMMGFGTMGLVGVLWVMLGYTLAFGDNGSSPYIGSLENAFMQGIDQNTLWGTFEAATGHAIPKYVFVMFQGMFAIITAALISGALIDRMKFSAFMVFIACWTLLVYSPLAHWVWDASGWLFKLGALDFAGGTVVHISSGVSALVAATLLGERMKTTKRQAVPHNIPYVLLGAGLLWFGWFGFNAGSALGANGSASLAFITTSTATSAAMLAWVLWEALRGQRPSAIGAATGSVVGLVAITPAAGFVSPMSAILIGMIAASCSFWVIQYKHRLKADDALDVFACHAVGGTVGSLLTGVFASKAVNGAYSGVIDGNWAQLGIQAVGVLAAVAVAAAGTWTLMKLLDAVFRVRVTPPYETAGLDLSEHAQEAYQEEKYPPLGTPSVVSGD